MDVELCAVGGFSIRELIDSTDDLKLRHEVFAERLGWVPQTATGLETDEFDAAATRLGAYRDGRLGGCLRMISKPDRWLIDKMLGSRLTDKPRSAELSRLAVSDPLALQPLLRGALAWCRERRIENVYFITPDHLVASFKKLRHPTWPIHKVLELDQGVVCSVFLPYFDEVNSHAY